MISLTFVTLLVLGGMLISMLILSFIDSHKRRVLKESPPISFIVPCYNDDRTVGMTIRSIYRSYEPALSEVIVIDDASADRTSDALRKIAQDYPIRIVTNQKNLGKSRSLNLATPLAKHDILLFVDADVELNTEAVHDMLARMQTHKVVAVSCPYKPLNRSAFTLMQELDYNVSSLIHAAYNSTSALAIWGGCFAVRRSAFEEVGMLGEDMLGEDNDLALKLVHRGYRVQQSHIMVRTYVPDTFAWWYRQRVRWVSGSLQCLFRHFRTFFRYPIYVVFNSIIVLMGASAIIAGAQQVIFIWNFVGANSIISSTTPLALSVKFLGIYIGAQILRAALVRFSFSFLSLPSVLPLIKRPSQAYKILYIIPFLLLYYPAYAIVSVVGTYQSISVWVRRPVRAW